MCVHSVSIGWWFRGVIENFVCRTVLTHFLDVAIEHALTCSRKVNIHGS
jgi:hypothetical protein